MDAALSTKSNQRQIGRETLSLLHSQEALLPSVVCFFPPSQQRLLVVVTGSYLSCCCLLRVSGQCWPLTSTTHFLHTTATHSRHCKQGWPGLPSGSFKNKTQLSYIAGESWDNYVGKNHTRLMQMTQSACRMNVDSGGGGGPCLIVIQRETRQQTAPSSLARLPWGNEGTLAIGCFVCGLITVGLSNELYSLSLHKKYSVFSPPPPAFVVQRPSRNKTSLSRLAWAWACIRLRSMFLKRVSPFQLF